MRMFLSLLLVVSITTITTFANDKIMIPAIDGDWWQVAGDPDLGDYTTEKQEPVDFGVWQAADGTWQIWSCIRHTNVGGSTRLFFRWQGENLTDPDWTPMGISMIADHNFGETPGGLQAPHVVKILGVYHMFYGDWQNICLAKSWDGKTFARRINAKNQAALFSNGPGLQSRDAMVIPIDGKYYCYYTAHENNEGKVFCRISEDLRNWSDAIVVAFGGQAGSGKYDVECPHVVYYDEHYYLFSTQKYGRNMTTSIYRSKDPLNFGINDDQYHVHTMPIAAPEVILHNGEYYLATLIHSLKGIKIAKMKWVEKE